MTFVIGIIDILIKKARWRFSFTEADNIEAKISQTNLTTVDAKGSTFDDVL